MRKIKFFLNIEKEKEFLTYMSKRGYLFIGKRGCMFRFEEMKEKFIPIYEIYYGKFDTEADFSEFVYRCKKAGWKLLQGNYQNGIKYFIQDNKKGCLEEKFESNNSEKRFIADKNKETKYQLFFLVMLIAIYAGVSKIDGRFASHIAVFAIPIFVLILMLYVVRFIIIRHELENNQQ